MKVAILAGGMGTRLAEETVQRPKALVEIGGKPVLWHIMKYYSTHGMNEFIIALGHKKEAIIGYFVDLYYYSSDLTINTGDGSITVHDRKREPAWIVHLIDTGLSTDTGGRIKRLAPYVENSAFMLTWCDGLSDVDLGNLLAFHQSHGKLVTVTAVRAPARFGYLELDREHVTGFREKPSDGEGWIKRRLLCFRSRCLQVHPGRHNKLGAGPDGTACRRGPTRRVSPQLVLAVHGHTPGEAIARGALG